MILSNVNIGTGPSSGDGSPLRSAFATINNNFQIVTNNVNALSNSVTSVAGRTGNIQLTVNDIIGAASIAYVNSVIGTGSNVTTNTGNVKFLDTEIYTETGRLTFYNYGAVLPDINRIDFETTQFGVDVTSDINLYAGGNVTLVAGNSGGAKIWKLDASGAINFPDSSTQTTAWTGFTANSANWSNPVPTTVEEAIDRLAQLVKTLNSGTGA